MAEKPRLFRDDMVRAILAGRKSQTRSPVKPQPSSWADRIECDWYEPTVIRKGEEVPGPQVYGFADEVEGWISPFGGPGDVLWVRECWADVNTESGPSLCYRADKAMVTWQEFSTTFGPNYGAGPSMDYDAYPGDYSMWWSDLLRGEPGHAWRPSIHMPRWACRITLPVVRVWVERVQDITPFDAIAEGCMPSHGSGFDSPELLRAAADIVGGPYPRGIFAKIWNDIYAKQGFGWDVNPWVWCCEFKEWKQ